MKSKYKDVMEHVEVTAEMQDRIMKNLHSVDFGKKQGNGMVNSRKYISIAACLVLLLVGAFFMRNMTKPPIQVVPDIVEYTSSDELSKGVGFMVREVRTLPFDAHRIQYFAYWKKLAHIVYEGNENTLIFRMSAGSDDISGDYNNYNDVKSFKLGNNAVTLKGNLKQYNLAVWEADGYSFSVNASTGIPEQELLKVVQSVQ